MKNSWRAWWMAGALSVFAMACGDDDGGTDAGAEDASAEDAALDVSSDDAGEEDASVEDAATEDGGEEDAALPVCGDGEVNGEEVCDTEIAAGEVGACPASEEDCPSDDACSVGSVEGEDCDAMCVYSLINTATDDDGCCPAGLSRTEDNDCEPAECGNGILETGESCDDGNNEDGDGCAADCDAEEDAEAYRVTEMTLADPHVFLEFAGTCIDGTDIASVGFNQQLERVISTNMLNMILLFTPFDTEAESTPFALHTRAACSGSVCSAALGPVGTTAENQAEGVCLDAVEDSLTDGYGEPNAPAASCFASTEQTVNLTVGTSITLDRAQAAGTYAGRSITDGVVRGFLTFEAARATTVSIMPEFGGDRTLYELLRSSDEEGGACRTRAMEASDADDIDGDGEEDGWWVYLNYTAQRVIWVD